MSTSTDSSPLNAARGDGDFQSPLLVEPAPLLSLRGWAILVAALVIVGLPLQMRPLLAVAAFLTVMVSVAGLWNHYVLHNVSYERAFSERRAFLGEQIQVTVHLTNWKILPISWLLTYDQWPQRVPLTDGGELIGSPSEESGYLINAFSVRGRQRLSRRYTLDCNRRGIYTFGPVRIRSGDLLGLFQQKGAHHWEDRLVVYPRILPLETLGLPPRSLFGEIHARQPMFKDPAHVIGARDHVPGDGLRKVHWKATARNQRLQTKVYEPTTAHNIVGFLNVATAEEHWRGADEPTLERAVTVTASIAYYAAGQQFGVGLVSNGSVYRSDQALKVPPGRSPHHLTHILEALAAVMGYATSPIESLLLSESPRLPWGATLVIVTAVLPEGLLAALIRLREVGRRLVLVALSRETPVLLPGVVTYHLPPRPSQPTFGRPAGKSDEEKKTALGSHVPLVFERTMASPAAADQGLNQA